MPGLFGTNPSLAGIDSYLDPRRGQLLALASGITSSPDFGQALSNGFAGAAQARPADTAYIASKAADAARQQQINQTAAWVKQNFPQYGSLPPEQGFQLAMQTLGRTPKEPVDPTSTYQGRLQAGRDQGLTGTELATYALTGNLPGDRNNSKFGNTPVMATDGKGNWIAVQPGSDGSTNQMQFPPGFHPDPGGLAGTKTTATVDATTAANARAALPGAQVAVGIAKNAIDLIRNDTKGLDEQFGNTGPIPNRNLPTIPGVFQQDKGNWQANFAQAKGQAFMQARNMLKGGGPITDYEGMKGEAAYSRMEQAVETGDKANFLRALDDFEAAVNEGYAKLQATANGDYSAGQPAVTGTPAPSGGGFQILSVE